jgi:hypothetical protein
MWLLEILVISGAILITVWNVKTNYGEATELLMLIGPQQALGWHEVHSFPIDEYTGRPLVIKNARTILPNPTDIGIPFWIIT